MNDLHPLPSELQDLPSTSETELSLSVHTQGKTRQLHLTSVAGTELTSEVLCSKIKLVILG